jgi:anti-sigma factor RsiW
MTCSMSVELGAYVLHALEHDDADAVQRHLEGCPQCQTELRELEFTASLLSLLSAEDLEQLEDAARPDDGHPEHDGVGGVRRSLRRHRAVLPLIAAVLAVATSLMPRTFEHAEPASSATVITAADPATHVSAAVSVDRVRDGTRLHLSLTGAYPQGWCSLVARSRDGHQDTAATWRADARGSADVAGMTAIPADRLGELDVVTGTGVVLVTIPMPGPHT